MPAKPLPAKPRPKSDARPDTKTRILDKLNLTSTADLVRYALENKLLS